MSYSPCSGNGKKMISCLAAALYFGAQTMGADFTQAEVLPPPPETAATAEAAADSSQTPLLASVAAVADSIELIIPSLASTEPFDGDLTKVRGYIPPGGAARPAAIPEMPASQPDEPMTALTTEPAPAPETALAAAALPDSNDNPAVLSLPEPPSIVITAEPERAETADPQPAADLPDDPPADFDPIPPEERARMIAGIADFETSVTFPSQIQPPAVAVPAPQPPAPLPAASNTAPLSPLTPIEPAPAPLPAPVDATPGGNNGVPGSDRIPVAGGGYVSREIVISPPSSSMPPDYFNLPLSEDAIPGVLIPELEDGYSYAGGVVDLDPNPAPAPAAPARPAATGMTAKQLEPIFALAKGSEGAALETRQNQNDSAYYDQLAKARDAYMNIVAMADAGNEAREEAWYGVARCEYRLGNWWKSFQALERSFPEEFSPAEVAGRMKLESFIGERLWRYARTPVPDAVDGAGTQLDGYQAAAKVYQAIVFNNPSHEDVALALLRQGDAASVHEDWEEAAKYYRQVVEYYADSEQAMQARSSLAEAIYRQEWPTGFPEAARRDVQQIMEDVERADASLSPEAADRRRRAVEIANDRDAEMKLRHAKEYLNSVKLRKSREGAIFMLKDIVTLYPDTKQAAEAAEMLVAMGETAPTQPRQDYSPFSPNAAAGNEENAGAAPASEQEPYVTLEVPGEEDIPSFVMPESPTRETVYEKLP